MAIAKSAPANRGVGLDEITQGVRTPDRGLDRRDRRTVRSHGLPAVAHLVQLLFGRLPGRWLTDGGVIRCLRSRRQAPVARYDVQLAIGLRDVPAEADRDTLFLFLSLQPDVADDEPAT